MFKDRLKDLRKTVNLSQRELAEKIHSAQTTVAGWESGKREPDFETVSRLANFFEVSTDYLLGNSDDPRPTYIYTDEEESLLKVMLEDPQFKEIYERLNKLGPEEQKLVLELVDRIAGSDDIDKKEQKKIEPTI